VEVMVAEEVGVMVAEEVEVMVAEEVEVMVAEEVAVTLALEVDMESVVEVMVEKKDTAGEEKGHLRLLMLRLYKQYKESPHWIEPHHIVLVVVVGAATDENYRTKL